MSPSLRDEIKQSKPFPSIEAEAYLNLIRTSEMLQGHFSRMLKRWGVSQPQYNALRILRGVGNDGMPCLEIADRMVTRAPDITRLVDRLQEAGFVSRRRSHHDRRVVRVAITKKGLALLNDLDGPVLAHHRQMLAHLDPEELRNLIVLLELTREASAEHGGNGGEHDASASDAHDETAKHETAGAD